ncbi:MAG: hypothetical protein H6726_01965 [Sandaracinaceae bacterium]|nr:hypothetical protein [Sandaracinaceae bacterium]
MSAYREPATPAESDRFITLPVTRARRVVLGPSLWFLAVWFLFFVLAGIVSPFATGVGWWKLPVCVLVWPLFPWGVTRVARMESVLVGATGLRRVGLWRERFVAWRDITDVRRFSRRVKSRDIPLIALESADGELVIAELAVDDPKGVLDWALAAATSDRLHEIEDRVRREGRPAGRSRWYAPHVAVALLLSAVFGWYLFRDARRRHEERILRTADDLPLAARAAAIEPIFRDASLPSSTRCRAATMLKYTLAHAGQAARAYEVCAEELTLDCAYRAPDACTPFAALRDAGAALEAGQAERALSLLEGFPHQGAARGAIEVEALIALGRTADALAASERCLREVDERDPTLAALAVRCRVAR